MCSEKTFIDRLFAHTDGIGQWSVSDAEAARTKVEQIMVEKIDLTTVQALSYESGGDHVVILATPDIIAAFGEEVCPQGLNSFGAAVVQQRQDGVIHVIMGENGPQFAFDVVNYVLTGADPTISPLSLDSGSAPLSASNGIME